MCAIVAGKRGRRVVVLEGSNKIGKKILMSGGGRCNFTNLNCTPANFVSANPSFCISALSRFSPAHFLEYIDKHSIAYHDKSEGQLFCDESSKDILSMLTAECEEVGVRILAHCKISSVERTSSYVVSCDKGEFEANSLVVATGGLSIPKMGASDFGYRLARQFGIDVLETRAALVPFTFTSAILELTSRLSGVSVRATASTGKQSFTDDVLFTHRGLSGPAILQLSSYWKTGDEIQLDLLPEHVGAQFLLAAKSSQAKSLLRTVLADYLPRALVLELQVLLWSELAERPLGEISDAALERLADVLHCWVLNPSGTEGYRTAEVTMGGVDTDALSSKTMESKQHAGLYFIGEVVDVTGQLGGYNFQWAWASAQAAGQVV
jgi:predicted Rossmann fold flavoprotein